MKINIKLLDSNNKINKQILSILSNEINRVFNLSLSTILISIKDIVKMAIISQPEYASLKTGQLRLEFGIPDTSIIDSVIDSMIDTTIITIKKPKITSDRISSGLVIEFLNDSDLQSITDSSNSFVYDKEYSLPWLKWLLFEGVRPIIKQYSVKVGPNKNSRTGMAIMTESNLSWNVPSQFAGNRSNNWITRAVDNIDDNKIISVIQQEIIKNI